MSVQSKPRSRGGKAVILQAAVQKFHELGYHGTSMRDIATLSNVTVASIYHHYPSKQQILQDVMMRTMVDALEATRGALISTDGTSASQLRAIMRAWVLFHAEHIEVALISGSELRSLEPAARQQVVFLRDQQEQMLRDVVERGIAVGEFSTSYPKEGVRALLNMGTAVASWYRADGDLAPQELADRYAELAHSLVLEVRRPDEPVVRH